MQPPQADLLADPSRQTRPVEALPQRDLHGLYRRRVTLGAGLFQQLPPEDLDEGLDVDILHLLEVERLGEAVRVSSGSAEVHRDERAQALLARAAVEPVGVEIPARAGAVREPARARGGAAAVVAHVTGRAGFTATSSGTVAGTDAGAESGAGQDDKKDGPIDADFEVVDDDKE